MARLAGPAETGKDSGQGRLEIAGLLAAMGVRQKRGTIEQNDYRVLDYPERDNLHAEQTKYFSCRRRLSILLSRLGNRDLSVVFNDSGGQEMIWGSEFSWNETDRLRGSGGIP